MNRFRFFLVLWVLGLCQEGYARPSQAQDAFAVKEIYLDQSIRHRRDLLKSLEATEASEPRESLFGRANRSFWLHVHARPAHTEVVETLSLRIDGEVRSELLFPFVDVNRNGWVSFLLDQVPMGIRSLGVELVLRQKEDLMPLGRSFSQKKVFDLIPMRVDDKTDKVYLVADLDGSQLNLWFLEVGAER